MAYQVVLSDKAKADANQIYDWIIEKAPVRGPEWFEELLACLNSLRELPSRCPLAREEAKTRRSIRCLHFGNRNHVYRILYEIEDQHKTVHVLHIRHGARRDLASRHLINPG